MIPIALLQDTAEQLTDQARQSDTLAQASSSGLERQRVETEQVATAVNQMAATTQEVANHVQRTADATQQANQLTRRGRDVADETRQAIQRLSTSVGETGHTVTQLAKDSNEIGSVVYVPELAGTPLPDGTLFNGCLRAEDAGLAIRGQHLDWFMGREPAPEWLRRHAPPPRVTVETGAPQRSK